MNKISFLGIILVMFLFMILLAGNGSAAVTQSGVTGNHSVGSDVVVSIIGAASDKNDPCFYEWVNETGGLLENDTTCTIPSSSPFQIFQSHKVLAGEAPQINLSGRLYVNDIFISQAFYNTTSTGGVNTLDIVDVETTTEIFEGKTAGIRGVIKNQGKLVGYADVCLDVLDENNEPFQHIGCKKSEVDGQFFFSARCDGTNWCNAGVSYIIDLDASCPKNSSSYISCINEDGDELDFANGGSSKDITVVDIANKFIIKKWIDAEEIAQPGVFVFNAFTSKVEMKKNPSSGGGYVTQQDIDWSRFNDTITNFTIEQNGQGVLTAGKTFTIGFIINNTFPDEIEFDVFECTLDDDNLSQEIFPLDPITKQRFGSEVIAHLFAKPSIEVGLVQKFTPPLLLAFDFVGGNDFDVQCKIKLHDFDQEITPESDEFHIFGEVQGTDFVPIIDIKNLTTSAFNTKQNACTLINVTINYDYFGAIEEEFIVEYHFEQTEIDVIVKTIKRLTKPDAGKNNNITDTFFLPFFEVSGEAEVFVEILNQDDIVVGFGDTEPHNTFNITADLSDECRYRGTSDQFLQARQARALEITAGATIDLKKTKADFFNSEFIGNTLIVETELMKFFINITTIPTNGNNYKINYFFFAREGDGTLIDNIETTIDGTLANHSVFIRSTNLNPTGVNETYSVVSVVSMKNSNGIYEDFPPTNLGTIKVRSLGGIGADGGFEGGTGSAGPYDVFASTLRPRYTAGQKVDAIVTITNTGDKVDDDVILVYWLTDPNDNKFGVTVENFLEVDIGEHIFVKSVFLPQQSVLGGWTFNVQLFTTVQSVRSSQGPFEVVDKLPLLDILRGGLKNVSLLVSLNFGIIFLVLFFIAAVGLLSYLFFVLK